MPKRSWNLNTVYISERLQECLRPISRCALTTVVAPMGYGKTTAVNWYLLERAKLDEAAVVRISVYSDNLAIFWKSVQEAFSHAGLDFLRAYPCPDDAAGGSLLTDDLCHALAGKRPCYIFIDDFHLLTDNRVPAFLCTLTNRLPENVHLIVASRDRFLPAEEILRLGGRLYTVGAEQLRLNHTELSIYAHRCGTELSDAQIESLLYSSEGWFSAIYLNLRTLHERGELPSRSSDIYAMFSAAMIDPLPSKRREFLAVMGLADEFTVEMAETVTGSKNTAAILQTLTEQNAFVKRLPDGVTFRFHHMMKDCAERTFHTMEPRRQAVYHNRYGEWYKTHGQYLHALKFYCLAKNYDAALRVIQRDAGILLTSLGAQQVLDFIAHCPVETLKEHPLSLLVLMRSMFTWRQIPKMLELKELLLAAITEHPDWPESERGDLLGECDLIMSFLMYNDISAMSRLHRSASAQMSRPAISIQKSGGWTFGSPSVLMMFYRASGELQSELAEMDECMPHYYKITNGHGQGAETIMRAEADFMRACFADAQIMLERAYAQIDGNGQKNMALCCDFLAWRLSLCTSFTPRESFEQRREALLQQHNVAWLNILQSSCAYYYALLGLPEKIPAVFREHQARLHPLPRARKADDGAHRKSGLPRPGRICQGHWPQRSAARYVRGDALCARRAAHPPSDRRGLRNARQARDGRRTSDLCPRRGGAGRALSAVCRKLPLSQDGAHARRGCEICRVCPDGHTAWRGLCAPLRRKACGRLPSRRPRGPHRARKRHRRACRQAPEQPRDRRAALFVRGQREAVHQSDLF